MGARPFQKIAVIGGGGYVGSALVPALLRDGYDVKVLDLFLFGKHFFDGVAGKERLACVQADLRNEDTLTRELQGMDAVIHLACISNDPSFELDPELGKSINYDAMPGLLRAAKTNKVGRLIYASSSSVYGVKEQPDVREDASCEPLTDYSKYKWLCEKLLAESGLPDYVIIRPATVCGYAPRLRLDLTVNILTIHALVKKKMTVFGGEQLRPNLNIKDMVDVYRLLLEAPHGKIHGETFNAGYSNLSVRHIAELVRKQIGDDAVEITVQPTNDIRSYHVNSDKIARVLGFRARYGLEDAIQSIVDALRAGRIPNPLEETSYYNIRVMQNAKIREPLKGVALLP